MTKDVTLEILDGESIEDAVKRLAAATQPDKPKKAPKKSAKHKPTDVDPTPPVGDSPPIYAAFHLYLLPGRTIEKLRSDAARERKMYGPGVQVFIHAHQPGEGCHDQCAERVE